MCDNSQSSDEHSTSSASKGTPPLEEKLSKNTNTKATFLNGDDAKIDINNSTINIIAGHDHISTSNSTRGARPKHASAAPQDIPEGYVNIFDNIYMNASEPIKRGTNVYKGFQLHVTGQMQWVAIKEIVPCTQKSIREVQHLVNLSKDSPHPNVVRITRSNVCEGLAHKELFIVMELCKEQNLQDFLDEKCDKPTDLKQARSFAQQLVCAIGHIHGMGIIHGDLKPENILLSLDGKEIKVSDFGISKQLRDSRSKTQLTGLGTDGYRAPETYSSDVISKSADVYSLGIILFALFTNGEHPFGKDHHLRVYNLKKNIDFDLSIVPEEMGSEAIDLLIKILRRDPETRPPIEVILVHPFFLDSLNQNDQVSDGLSPDSDGTNIASYTTLSIGRVTQNFSYSDTSATPRATFMPGQNPYLLSRSESQTDQSRSASFVPLETVQRASITSCRSAINMYYDVNHITREIREQTMIPRNPLRALLSNKKKKKREKRTADEERARFFVKSQKNLDDEDGSLD